MGSHDLLRPYELEKELELKRNSKRKKVMNKVATVKRKRRRGKDRERE